MLFVIILERENSLFENYESLVKSGREKKKRERERERERGGRERDKERDRKSVKFRRH